MKKAIAIATAIIMAGCAKIDFEEMVESPAVIVADSMCDVTVNTCGNGWQIYAIYFLDKDTGRVKSKIRKVINGNRWYYVNLMFPDMVIFETAERCIAAEMIGEKDEGIVMKYDNVNETKTNYFKCDSVGEYKVIKDVDPFLLMADYELRNVAHSFTYGSDTIRLHRCGYFPKDNSNYSLIVVTRKEGELAGITK